MRRRITEHLTGNILRKAGPVAVVVIEIIVIELNDLRLEQHKTVLCSRVVLGENHVLYDGVPFEDGLIQPSGISGPVLLIVGSVTWT